MNIISIEYGNFRLTDDGRDKDSHGKTNVNRFLLLNRRTGSLLRLNKQEYDYIRASKSAMMACIEVERWHERKKGVAVDVT